MSIHRPIAMSVFDLQYRRFSTTGLIFGFLNGIETPPRAHCDQCDHFYTSCRRCMKAYRKQKEGRTRKNYIYGGKNPLIRKDILSD